MEHKDLLNDIMDYEAGMLDEVEVAALFQNLVDTDVAWRLQGHYGRTAQALIDRGIIERTHAE